MEPVFAFKVIQEGEAVVRRGTRNQLVGDCSGCRPLAAGGLSRAFWLRRNDAGSHARSSRRVGVELPAVEDGNRRPKVSEFIRRRKVCQDNGLLGFIAVNGWQSWMRTPMG